MRKIIHQRRSENIYKNDENKETKIDSFSGWIP